MANKLPTPKTVLPFLSDDYARMRDALLVKIADLWKIEKKKPKEERRWFIEVLNEAAVSMRYKSYRGVPQVIRSAVRSKMAMIKIAYEESERLHVLNKRQPSLKFTSMFDPEQPKSPKEPPNDPFGDMWQGRESFSITRPRRI